MYMRYTTSAVALIRNPIFSIQCYPNAVSNSVQVAAVLLDTWEREKGRSIAPYVLF